MFRCRRPHTEAVIFPHAEGEERSNISLHSKVLGNLAHA